LEIDERFGTQAQKGENPLGPYRRPDQRFAVESYLDHQADKLVKRFDAGSYVTLTDALNRHDIGRGRGGLNKALESITIPVMVAAVDTDILYPYHQQEHLTRNLGHLLAIATIVAPVGHDAFLTESRQMDRILRNFFSLISPELENPSNYIEFFIYLYGWVDPPAPQAQITEYLSLTSLEGCWSSGLQGPALRLS